MTPCLGGSNFEVDSFGGLALTSTSLCAMPRQTTVLIFASIMVQSIEQLQERIRQRAYELYEQRGREDGRDFDDWVTAESEVTRNCKA